MNAYIFSSVGTIEGLYGFKNNYDRRTKEITNKKEALRNWILLNRMKLIGKTDFADQDEITYGSGYKLFLRRDTFDNDIIRDEEVATEKVAKNDISCFAENFRPNLDI